MTVNLVEHETLYAVESGEQTFKEGEREWCIKHAEFAGEGYYNKEELTNMNDKDLACCTLTAFTMYCTTHFE